MTDDPPTLTATQYGFIYGPAEVLRVAHHGKSVWIEIRSKKQSVMVRVKGYGQISVEYPKKGKSK